MSAVTVLGPNMTPREQRGGEDQHVHAAGCADIKRRYRPSTIGDGWTFEAESIEAIVKAVYPPGQFDWDGTADDYPIYRGALTFYPCVTLPEHLELEGGAS